MTPLPCPVPDCGTDNDHEAESCTRCGVPLRGYQRLTEHPARLFNAGLAAARSGDVTVARDLFAAVVHWCPLDWEARTALAMSCFQLGDRDQARHHWTTVLTRHPTEPLATTGLARLAEPAPTDG